MAIVKKIKEPIKSHTYLFNSIDYVLSPENENKQEKCFMSSCLNCSDNGSYGLAIQFYATRAAFHKDNKVLAHHYVQSFSPNDNITPEKAHQLGVELAEKIAPNFQVIVSTHVDKDHIHNHILINAVNIKTGLKWKDNKATLENMRRESDKLCVREGLQIIDKRSGLKGLDQSTRETAKKGQSWKIKLCHDLEAAIKVCKSKIEFVQFMEARNYEIDYKDNHNHIVFRNKNFAKKIRADTLAKQFGSMFSKTSLEKAMGYYKVPDKSVKSKAKISKDILSNFESEWERFSTKTFDESEHIESSKKNITYIRIKNSPHPFLELMRIIFLNRKKKKYCDKKYHLVKCKMSQGYLVSHQFAIKQWKEDSLEERLKSMTKVVGNIPYKALTSAQGKNFRVKVSSSHIANLFNCPFFFSAKIENNTAIVTVKENDKMLLTAALGLENSEILEKHNEQLTNKMNFTRLKDKAKELGVKVEYLVIDKEKLKLLQEKYIDLAYFEKEDGKINIAFLPSSKKRIFDLLYNKKKNKEHNEELARNTEINKELKAIEALGKDTRLVKIVEAECLSQLQKLPKHIKYAYFRKKDGKINIVYLSSQAVVIENALKLQTQTEKKNNVNLKR